MSFNFTVKEFILGNGTPTLQFYKRGFELNGNGESPSWQDIILSGNTALTLTNALANGLNYLKLFGGTEQSGTPSPDTPMDIVCNNGVIKVSPNLWNPNATTNYWINTEGKLVENAQTRMIRIPATPNDVFTLSATYPETQASNIIVLSFRDSSDNNLLRQFANATASLSITSTAPAGTKSICFAHYVNTPTTIQVEAGSTATQYRPYGQIYTDGTQETVEITGKNLFDYRYFYDNYQTYSPSAVGRCPIKLQPNTQYTVSTNKEVYSTSASMFVVSGSAIDWAPNTADNGILVNSPRTVTTDSNGYLCFGLYVASGNAIPESDFINGTVWVQIELGSTATTYEPYYNGGSATAEMLLSVGDYQDTQEVLGGNVSRNIGILVLDGSEDWKVTYQEFFDAPLPGHIASAPAYCNYFQSVTTGTVPPVAERANKVWLGSTWVGLGATTKFSTVNTFKQWLATQYANGSPVIVVYPLATPTTETVTGQPLSIQAGTNIVEITQASIDNLGLEVSYKATT